MKNLFTLIFVIVITLAMSAFGAWLVMLLWNWVVVAIFGLPKLSFWLAWGLTFLIGLIFGRDK
jgi:hypothetical protein